MKQWFKKFLEHRRKVKQWEEWREMAKRDNCPLL
ncbi:hypothetical protein bas27_0181 [Escherichia phage TrudiGerster]|uniref:Uncharacterized protein n=1 Tax=Escherichia phage TrudiGerster TaxID=2851991 RepID=A0AAE7VZT5_9CAUD|nr:hypothetical protein bas27_0181 [Escherichia phage TrudiGerster]